MLGGMWRVGSWSWFEDGLGLWTNRLEGRWASDTHLTGHRTTPSRNVTI